jgi:hypothetical protein
MSRAVRSVTLVIVAVLGKIMESVLNGFLGFFYKVIKMPYAETLSAWYLASVKNLCPIFGKFIIEDL